MFICFVKATQNLFCKFKCPRRQGLSISKARKLSRKLFPSWQNAQNMWSVSKNSLNLNKNHANFLQHYFFFAILQFLLRADISIHFSIHLLRKLFWFDFSSVLTFSDQHYFTHFPKKCWMNLRFKVEFLVLFSHIMNVTIS